MRGHGQPVIAASSTGFPESMWHTGLIRGGLKHYWDHVARAEFRAAGSNTMWVCARLSLPLERFGPFRGSGESIALPLWLAQTKDSY